MFFLTEYIKLSLSIHLNVSLLDKIDQFCQFKFSLSFLQALETCGIELVDGFVRLFLTKKQFTDQCWPNDDNTIIWFMPRNWRFTLNVQSRY